MSGHSHFNSIGGNPLPQVIPPAVGEINVGGSQQVGGVGTVGTGAQEPQQTAQVDAKIESTKELVRQLDVLLSRAAASATKTVDAKALKATLNGAEGLATKTRATIYAAAKEAEKSFKAIDSFTGRQLARTTAAENGKFSWDMTNPAGVAIKKALDAQAKLSDLLRAAVNNLPAGEVSNSLTEAMFQCDRRFCEIQTLVCEFAGLAEKGDAADPNVKAMLGTKLSKLLPQKALVMHDNEGAIEAMKNELSPLAKRLDAIAKNPGTSVANEEIAAIGREIDQVSNALGGAVESGSINGVFVDRTLFGAAKDVLEDVKAKLGNARGETLKASMLNFAERAFRPLPFELLSPKFLPFLNVAAPTIANAVEKLEQIRKATKKFAKEPTDENLDLVKQLGEEYEKIPLAKIAEDLKTLARYDDGGLDDDLDAEGIADQIEEEAEDMLEGEAHGFDRDDLVKFASLVKNLCDDVKVKGRNENDYLLNKMYKAFRVEANLRTQIAHLVLMSASAEKMDDSKFLTHGSVYAAFEGRFRVTTLVESRIHGLGDDAVDPMLDDMNAESSRPLGSGSVNTVYEVTYKNGEKYVFKPEAEGRMALENLTLSKGLLELQMVAHLNIASQKTADILGLGDVMTKTTVGSHKGAFGIFMEKVPGEEANFWKNRANWDKFPEGQRSPQKIRELPDADYAKVVGGLMRKANRLEWFDMITGQGDRHNHNYMLSVGEGGSVVLKGIDNDACFPAYRTGIRTFELDKEMSESFFGALRIVATNLYPGDSTRIADLANELAKDPSITVKDGTVTVDTSKAKSKLIGVALKNSLGVHMLALPDCIDKELYDKLMELDGSEDKFKAAVRNMTAHLPKAAAKAATGRLKEAIAHAKALKEKGMVISENAWTDHDVQRKIAGKVPKSGHKDDFERLPKVRPGDPDFNLAGEKSVSSTAEHVSNGYFRRDLMRAVARPGWFEV